MTSRPTVQVLDLLAHDLRNALGVLTSAATLLRTGDDSEIGVDLDAATRVLHQHLDRIIECARCEQGHEGLVESITISQLLDLVRARLKREAGGGVANIEVDASCESVLVTTRTSLAERVVADVMKIAGAPATPVTVRASHTDQAMLSIEGTHDSPTPPDPAARILLETIAAEAGMTISLPTAGRARILVGYRVTSA